jgi:hypothetical protein
MGQVDPGDARQDKTVGPLAPRLDQVAEPPRVLILLQYGNVAITSCFAVASWSLGPRNHLVADGK